VVSSAGTAPVMLKLLKIKNIAVVAAVELEFGDGLNVLTGETGAGKSILIDALGLLLGARASPDLIRTGEEQAVVEALLDGAGATRVLEAHGLPVEEDELILRREIHVSGKGRASVNGALVPLAVLRELAPWVATIHGQHGPQGLLDADTHLEVLDRNAELTGEAAAVAEAYRRLREVEGALRALREDRTAAERKRESLAHQVEEIERAALVPGEEEALRQEKAVQANAGRLAALTAEAYALLYDAEDAVLPRLGQVYRKIEDLGRIDPRVEPFLEARVPLRAQLEDLAFFLRDYAQKLEVTPGRLDAIESRLALIERLKRRYNASVEEMLASAASGREELARLQDPAAQERALDAQRAEATAGFLKLARALSKRRRAAGLELAARVRRELGQLAMEKTGFEVAFQPLAPDGDGSDTTHWTERGLDAVEFLLSPNPGEELRPLARIASGGELSRILLALNAVAAGDRAAETLVFDEVDAGIGGRVAEVVGRKLRTVAASHQVLCVTHLPQIASLADRHYAVSKREVKGRTVTEVRPLDGGERIEEVARMLGGATITDTTRRHAREMVKQGEK
jgi:DNA repair protein RecN (Recombination protein N)